MSASIEDLVRAAQQEQAHRAVHPQRILAALPRRRAQLDRRRRLTVAAVAAAAVTAVLAVPVISLVDRGAGPVPQPAVTPSVSVSPSVGTTPSSSVALRYRPTWLPDGYAEYFRSSHTLGTSRVWSPTPPADPVATDRPILFLNVTPAGDPEVAREDSDQEVDVSGVPGIYRPGGELVSWPGGGFSLTVGTAGSLTLSKSTLLRVARSVRPDSEIFEAPFRSPRLPEGWYQVSRGVSGVTPDDWVASISLGDDPLVPAGTVEVAVGTATTAPKGGRTLRVAGHPARYVTSSSRGDFLVVDLGAGRLLTVRSVALPKAEMIKLAEDTGPLTTKKIRWIGR